MRVEDRWYLGCKLFYELIPANVRQLVPRFFVKNEWGKIINYVQERALGRCEICGARKKKLHVHERFGISGNILVLKRFVGVCEACHLTIHPGNAQNKGVIEQIFARYSAINKVPVNIAKADCMAAMNLWKQRNDICIVDWSMIANEPYSDFVSQTLIREALASSRYGEDIVPLAYIPQR